MANELEIIPPGSLNTALTRADTNPVAVYLSTLNSPLSRRTMLDALGTIATLGFPPMPRQARHDAACRFPWWEMGYQHSQAIKTRLVDQKRSPATVNLYLSALRGVLAQCWRLNLMSAEQYHRAKDVATIDAKKLPAGRMLSQEEIKKLFDAAENPRDKAILNVLVATGLRRTELVGLDAKDYSQGIIRVRHGKRDKEREVPIESTRWLDAWLAVRGNDPGPLFYNQQFKTSLTAQAVYFILTQLAQKAEIAHFSPHDLRRTFISNAIDGSDDLFAVMDMVGHERSDTTKRYDRRGEKAKRRVAKTVYIPE